MFTCDVEKTKDRKKRLQAFYSKWYENGVCSHSTGCEPDKMANQYWERYDWTCRIGDHFDMLFDNKELRIVVVGKEALTPRYELCEPASFSEVKNRHWCVTSKYLCLMFGYENRKEVDHKNVIHRMMSLTNRYACLFRKKKDQKSGILNTDKQNAFCLERLRAELKILQPTVIMIQNDRLSAQSCFEDAIVKKSFDNGSVSYSISGNCYIINTSHPCCRSHPWASDLKQSIEFVREIGWLPKVCKENTDELNDIIRWS